MMTDAEEVKTREEMMASYILWLLKDMGLPYQRKRPESFKKLEDDIDNQLLFMNDLLSTYGWASKLARAQEEGGELGVRRLRLAVGDLGFSEIDEVEELISFAKNVQKQVLERFAKFAPGKLVK